MNKVGPCLFMSKTVFCVRKGLLERGFVMSKVDPCLFMYKTVICVVYVGDCLFWARSQSEIDNVMNSFLGGWYQL